ncbi:MAG TPA: hypothetical protein ENJ32_10175 [Crenotrichaceae bacterium]|nr:hypothetical protein [Crenotrichaceae bacterium]
MQQKSILVGSEIGAFYGIDFAGDFFVANRDNAVFYSIASNYSLLINAVKSWIEVELNQAVFIS